MELEPVTLVSQELVLSIFEAAPGYFLHVEGRLPTLQTAQEAIGCTPRTAGPAYRKEFLVIRREGRPVGTVELHIHHPDEGCVYIGLLLIREDLQGRGVGRASYERLERYLRDRHGAERVRLGVSDDHDVSGFWTKLGFKSNGRAYSYDGERKSSHVVEYEKAFPSSHPSLNP